MAFWLAALAAAAPLSLGDVLDAVDARVPELVAVEAKLGEARAKLLATRGAFDPVLTADVGRTWGDSPETFGSLGVEAKSAWGPEASLVWRTSSVEADEVVLGGRVPLLDGLGIPAATAEVWTARAGVALAEAEQADERVRVRRKATDAYWKWVAAGEKLGVEQSLLSQVEKRQAALTRQVEEGTRPRLELLDNARAVLQRRDAVAQAEQALVVAGLELSLWYRDPRGEPIVPAVEARPALETVEVALPSWEQDRVAVEERPDVRAVEALVDAASADRSRARNALLPSLDLVAEASRVVGDEAAEVYGGAALSLPVLARKERGALSASNAALDRLGAVRRGTVDAARAEVRAARRAVETSWQRVQWTREAEALAAEVVALERRRFQLGVGDLFELLAREANLASAQKAAVDAALDHELALAARRSALGR